MRMLFIVGCPRSGTTLLQQILNRHPAIVIPPETAFFSDFLKRTRRGQQRHLARVNRDLGIELEIGERIAGNGAARELFDELARRYLARRFPAGPPPDLGWFGDKTPFHLFEVERIRRLYPEARFLLVHRDGRAVALSLSEVPWSPDDPELNFAIWLRCWRARRRLLGGGPAHLLSIAYESLVSQPEAELRRILDFLELSARPGMLAEPAPDGGGGGGGKSASIPQWEMEWKARARGPILPERAERWKKELSAGQIARLEAWGAEELRSLGYELTLEPPAALPPLYRPRMGLAMLAWRAAAAGRLLRANL